MKLQQILSSALERWKDISGLDFCILDQNNQPLISTSSNHRLPSAERLEEFRNGRALCLSNNTCHLFKLKENDEFQGLLAVFGTTENGSVIGELAVCQIESLVSAYSEKTDKNSFIQNLLQGRYQETEAFNRAHRLHISTSVSRIVLILEGSIGSDESILTMIRTLFNSRGRDFVTAFDDNETILVHEIGPGEDSDSFQQTAQTLVDMLNTEIMIPAKVSYSNPAEDLNQLANAYKEARTALEVGKIFSPDHSVFGYSHLGIGRLLYQLPDEICEMFIDEIFREESLESLDEETLNIIRTFFQNNLNLSETSRQLYVHRNTLVYRFEKLQKKFGLDIRTFEDALTFKLAMMVSDYLKYRKREK